MTTTRPLAPAGSDQPAFPGDAVLEFRGVTYRYGAQPALDGISFAVPAGTITGLVGSNGSGKSTLIKLAAGLLRPWDGEVRVLGHEPDLATKRQLAYVAEDDPLFPWMTVREAIAFIRAFFPDWDEAREAQLLDILDLPTTKRVSELSKGMRTRLRLLLALARPAPLVLLDEPFSGIDPLSRSRIARGILAGWQEGRRTILLSTHDLKDAEPLFDRLLVLRSGRLILEGDVENLRQERGKSVEAIIEEALVG